METRLATPEDYDFLYYLRRAAMKTYVEQTWGWDEVWQQQFFRQHFNPDALQIIRFDNEDVGMLSIERKEAEIYLKSIEILPAYQGRGIGTSIVQEILTEARQSGKRAGLQVLKVNRARELYERLGFLIVGETPTHFLMNTEL